MKLKLDENLGPRGLNLLQASGHDVATVREEGLGGASDATVLEACVAEERTLITLDHDFGNVLRFPPESSYGIVILEIPGRVSGNAIARRLEEFLAVVAGRPLRRELWIVSRDEPNNVAPFSGECRRVAARPRADGRQGVGPAAGCRCLPCTAARWTKGEAGRCS